MITQFKKSAKEHASEYRATYCTDGETARQDLDFEIVKKAFSQFLSGNAVPANLRDDCYQEAWVAWLDRNFEDIQKYLKCWLKKEYDWHKPRLYSLEEKCKQIAERNEEGKRTPKVHDIIDALVVQGRNFVRKHIIFSRGARSQVTISKCVNILLQWRRGRITPYHIAVARLDGVCPWCAARDMEFANNRTIGLCHKCSFAFYTVEND